MNRKLKTTELNRLNIEDFKASEKLPFSVILDNVRSASNVGSVFRTIDAFKGEKVYLCGITPAPPHREINKTALGATNSVTWEYSDSCVQLIKKLKEEGYRILAIEQTENSVSLEKFSFKKEEKIALVLGNEVNGVDQEVINHCHGVLEIPQYGTKHSLNVSVCAGITMWEISKAYII